MKNITAESFYEFGYVSSPEFAPDGRRAAFLLRRVKPDRSGYDCDVWLLDTASGEYSPLTTGGDATGFIWTKSGELLAPLERDGDKKPWEERTDFYALTPAGAELRFSVPLDRAELEDLDGVRFIACARRDLFRPDFASMPEDAREAAWNSYRNPPYHVLTDAPFRENGAGFTSGLRDTMYIFNSATGALTAVTEPEFTAIDPRFGARIRSVRGTKIAYKGMYWPGGLRPTFPGVYVYDYETGEKTTLIPQDAVSSAFMSFWADDEILLGASDKSQGFEQYDEFYTLPASGGKLRSLRHYEHFVDYPNVTTDAKLGGGRGSRLAGDRFWFISSVGDYSYLYYITRGGDISPAQTPDGAVFAFDVHGDDVLLCGMYGGRLPELYLNGAQVTHFNDAFLAGHGVSAPEAMSFTDTDGVDIHGWVMKPAGYEPGRKYPGILFIHGGPETIFSDVFHHEMQLWAANGYFVFFCNPRGSDGRGFRFLNLCGAYGTVDYKDIMEFTDAVLARTPDIDPARLAVCGGSYGGYMTNWIIGHTDRFACACSQRSIASWTSQEHISDIGANYTLFEQDATTASDAAKLWEHSPLKFAHNCKTPTLFIHSDMDFRCPLEEGLMMYTALSMTGCPTKLCLFHGENHELSRSGRPCNRLSRMREILAWFDQWLKA